jgi:hypothetical protein
MDYKDWEHVDEFSLTREQWDAWMTPIPTFTVRGSFISLVLYVIGSLTSLWGVRNFIYPVEPAFLAIMLLLLAAQIAGTLKAYTAWKVAKVRAATPKLPWWLEHHFLGIRCAEYARRDALRQSRLRAIRNVFRPVR